MHARMEYASNCQRIPIPQEWPLFTIKLSPSSSSPSHQHPITDTLINRTIYLLLRIVQTSAFIIPNHPRKEWCTAALCFYFSWYKNLICRYLPSNPTYDDWFNSIRLGRSILPVVLAKKEENVRQWNDYRCIIVINKQMQTYISSSVASISVLQK